MKVKTTAENRKDVVKAMEEILNVKAKYQGPPSFGYKVGESIQWIVMATWNTNPRRQHLPCRMN